MGNGRRKKRTARPTPQFAARTRAAVPEPTCEVVSQSPPIKGEGLFALGVLAALTLGMFGHVLFASKPIVLSTIGRDLSVEYVYTRPFGFDELAKGNLALWNPHIFGGVPYFGGFQSALLYPPNWLYMVLPFHRAVNIGIALHVWLLGALVYLWGRGRGLSLYAGLLAGALAMFSAPHFMHIEAGHLSNLCTMAWAPLVLLALDGWFDRRAAGYLLAGMGAVAMQILAGHPQYMFLTAVAAGLYTLGRVAWGPRRLSMCIGLAAIYVGAVALGAVQLFTGLQAAGENVRTGGVDLKFAGMFSFPPEALLTMLTPTLFGGTEKVAYWGRWYYWETSAFFGAAGAVLAVIGAIWGDKRSRRLAALTAGLLLVLALGRYTPVHRLLYHWVPPFDKFRGMTKFIFPASLFAVILAGAGLDAALRRRRGLWVGALGAGVVGLAAGGAALWVWSHVGDGATGPWREIITSLDPRIPGTLKQVLIDFKEFSDPAYVNDTARLAAESLAVAAISVLASAVCIAMSRRRVVFAYVLAGLAVAEVYAFAAGHMPTFETKIVDTLSMMEIDPKDTSDYRIYDQLNENEGMRLGKNDIWGNGPDVSARWATFLSFVQGEDPDETSQYLPFKNWDNGSLYAMLRLKYLLLRAPPKGVRPGRISGPMNRLHLVGRWVVIPHRDGRPDRKAMFALMGSKRFEPRELAVLESPPDIEPPRIPFMGTVKLVDSSTDHLVVEAETPTPAILLITDAYSRHWRARPLIEGGQRSYRVMPANYCLQGVPLKAGRHRILIEYAPSAFRIGKWVSILSLAVYAAVWIILVIRRRRGSEQTSDAALVAQGHLE